jgi:hypothetical protein
MQVIISIFVICLTQELINNVIHEVWHVSIQFTATFYSSYHNIWHLDPTRRRITCKLIFFIQDRDKMINHEWLYPFTGFSGKPSTCGAVERISRSWVASNMVAASRCRLLDIVGSSPLAGPWTLAVAAVESTSWSTGITVGTVTWERVRCRMECLSGYHNSDHISHNHLCWWYDLLVYAFLDLHKTLSPY